MIGKKIKELRIKANLTQEELANKLFVSRSLIAKWEQENAIPQKEYIEKMSDIFNCPIFDISPIIDNTKTNTNYSNVMLITIVLLITFMLIITSILGVYVSNKEFFDDGFSNKLKREWNIKYLSMPHNMFVIKKNPYEITYVSTEEEYNDYCNYLFYYFKSLAKIDKLYYLSNVDNDEKMCYFKQADDYSLCYINSNLFNVYYIKNDNYYLVSLIRNEKQNTITIRLGSDILISEKTSNRIQIQYCVIFEE